MDQLPSFLKIPGDRPVGDIFHIQIFQGVRVQVELPAVSGENKYPIFTQQLSCLADQYRVIPLDIEISFHPLGARIAGRIQENKVVTALLFHDPVQDVEPDKGVAGACVAVKLHVPLRPIQVRIGKIHGGCGLRPACGCINRSRSRITEQVKKAAAAFSTDHLSDSRAYRPVIQEQARVKVVGQVHQELQPVFLDLGKLSCLAHFTVLGGAFLATADL